MKVKIKNPVQPEIMTNNHKSKVINTRTIARAHTHALTNTHTQTHTHKHTLTNTHTRTHIIGAGLVSDGSRCSNGL